MGMRVESCDRYVVGPAIAQGGMGRVRLGRLVAAAGFSRTVAMKQLKEEFVSSEARLRGFIEEARVSSRVRHANVVSTLDLVGTGPDRYIVMEYVEGESLASLASGRAVPAPIAVGIVLDVLAGLQAVHAAVDERGHLLGLVHRDIAPQNVIVGVDGVARILDFGVARVRDGRKETGFRGRWAYAAPELIEGGEPTPSSDVFAVGVVLWEALSGQRLFAAENREATIYRVLEDDPPEIEGPPKLREVVSRALAKVKSDRFASATELSLALSTALQRADAHVVAEWVWTTARQTLRARAEVVRELESVEAPPAERGSARHIAPLSRAEVTVSRVIAVPRAAQAPTEPASRVPESTAPRAWLVLLPAGAFVVACIGVLVGVALRGSEGSRRIVAPRTVERDPSPAERQDRSREATPAAHPPPVRREHQSCEPPYRVDQNGTRHYYPWCL